MLNNNLQFDHELFARLYGQLVKVVIEVTAEVEAEEEDPDLVILNIDNYENKYQGHEWIDIDDTIRRNNDVIRHERKGQKK
jgi:hypothetical protein